MVEKMDHEQDVERLFSWLKAPMVHYREFAPRVEVAEAVATWPVLHRAAVETGATDDRGPGPQGAAVAYERLARERMTMPAAAAQALRESSPMGGNAPATPAAAEDHALDAAAATSDQGYRAEGPTAPSPYERQPVGEQPPMPEPVMMTFEEPVMAARTESREAPRAAPPPPPPAAGARSGLFTGEYRGREREARPSMPVADRQDRSLDAVFSRLSGAREGLPDPRARARTNPGLGAVFGRLR